MAENVRSVSRIFDILEILARQKEPVSLTEIARGCGLSKATA
ncbi:MAG: helix-turn-helix domain-containing protein, partial [Lachnospiraceae bacterium]|nr:helix-turn-helix domain-containing protein [Lachnospiraceae bacterium]